MPMAWQTSPQSQTEGIRHRHPLAFPQPFLPLPHPKQQPLPPSPEPGPGVGEPPNPDPWGVQGVGGASPGRGEPCLPPPPPRSPSVLSSGSQHGSTAPGAWAEEVTRSGHKANEIGRAHV